ncbi:hypothetical protein ACFQU7_25675 [Pseudoroseomonas wenyumeiae]
MPQALQVATNDRGRDAELPRQLRNIDRLPWPDVGMQNPVHEAALDQRGSGLGLAGREEIRRRRSTQDVAAFQEPGLLQGGENGADRGPAAPEFLCQCGF